MLVGLKEILQDARAKKYGVPAFDVSNYEMVKCVLETCAEEKSPCIFMGLKCDLEGNGLKLLTDLMRSASEIYDIPVCIHLDHATNLEDIKKAIDAGFTSVMFDGSVLPFDQNVEKTKEVALYAHSKGVTVEAELGHVADAISGTGESLVTGKDAEGALTDPEEARRFVELTNVDALAVSIGTAHGVYVSTPVLQFDILKEIDKVCGCPLVLHGGSGTPDKDVQKAISLGITKINIYSEVLNGLNNGLKEKLNSIENMSMWPIFVFEKAKEKMKEVIRHKIRTFGSNNRV